MMKRWDYNTLKGEVWLFTVFLSIMVFEIFGAFYIIFLAEGFCTALAKDIGSAESAGLMTWLSRIIVAFYMYLAGWLFFRLVEKQGKI